MNTEVVAALIAATSALAGSAIGGIASYFSTKSMRKIEWQLSEVEREIASRRVIYAKFLAESNSLLLRSFDQKINSLVEVQELLNLHSEIALISPQIGEKAKEIVSCVLDYHQKDQEQHGSYPALRDSFINLCRNEVHGMRYKI